MSRALSIRVLLSANTRLLAACRKRGTVLVATAFGSSDEPVTKTAAKRLEAAVMREVAEELGNTPAVARSAYVDPRVVTGCRSGLTIAAAACRAARLRDAEKAQLVRETATRRLIRKVVKIMLKA